MVKSLYSISLTLLLTGCFIPVDTVVNIEGDIVDKDGNVYSECLFELIEEDRVLFSAISSGTFRHTQVIGGFNYKRAHLAIECKGGERKIKINLPKLPRNITEYMNIGTRLIDRKADNKLPHINETSE